MSNALSAGGPQVRDTRIAVNGHEQVEFREQRMQLGHDAIGTAGYEGLYVWAAYPNSGGS